MRIFLMRLLLICCGLWSGTSPDVFGQQLGMFEPRVAYKIGCYTQANKYIKVTESGQLTTDGYADLPEFQWEFVSAGDSNYYVRNLKTGQYIQSSKLASGAQVSVGSSPVAYRIMKDTKSGSSTAGHYFLCSIDQPIDNATAGTKGLNYGNPHVVAYDIVSGRNRNSYWDILPAKAVQQTFSAEKYYTIASKTNSVYFMSESAGGMLATSTFSNTSKIFWQILPVEGEPDTYYIKNAVTGDYVQSSNVQRSSQISMGRNPVKYRIGIDRTAGASTYGFYYLFSLDQPNTTQSSAIGLNFDYGASKNVVAWSSASGDNNSYWIIQETDLTYDPQYLPAVPSVADLPTAVRSLLLASDGDCLSVADGVLAKEFPQGAALRQAWMFVGTGNNGGYLLVNAAHPDSALAVEQGEIVLKPIDDTYRWTVEMQPDYTMKFVWKATATQAPIYLAIGTADRYRLEPYRNAFTLGHQIYFFPCGSLANSYIERLDIDGPHTPVALHFSASSRPAHYYTLHTLQQPVLVRGGKFRLHLKTSVLPDGAHSYAYFDWDRDGRFERALDLGTDTVFNDSISVPSYAVPGVMRIRMRITDNGMEQAEDDVVGTVYDFVAAVSDQQHSRSLTVVSADSLRGEAGIVSGDTLIHSIETIPDTMVRIRAIARSGHEFLYWKVGHTIYSTEPECTLSMNEHRNMVAHFTPPHSSQISTGGLMRSDVSRQNFVYDLSEQTSTLRIFTEAKVLQINLYDLEGKRVRTGTGKSLSVAGLPYAAYIVQVVSHTAKDNRKIIIK